MTNQNYFPIMLLQAFIIIFFIFVKYIAGIHKSIIMNKN